MFIPIHILDSFLKVGKAEPKNVPIFIALDKY